MPRCVNCGNEILETASFCSACGQPAPRPPATPVPDPGPYSPPLGEYLKKGWGLFKQYPGGFVGFCLLFFAIQGILSCIPWIGGLTSFAISTPLWMGGFIVSAKLLQGRTPQFQDFFWGFNFFLPLLLVTLVGGTLTAIGLLLLIIPGVYLMVGYLFASALVVDRGLDFWPALELSRRTLNPRWFSIFGFLLLLMLINLGGALMLGLGLLITIPLTGCALTVAYADIFGLQSRYGESFPGNTA